MRKCSAVCEELSASTALLGLFSAVLCYGVNGMLSVQRMLSVGTPPQAWQAKVPIGLHSCCV